MVTSASAWKAKAKSELELPSGNKCIARRKGLEAFVQSGKVPNALMPMLTEAMGGKTKQPNEIVNQLDAQTIADMFVLFDLVAVTVMLDPPCRPAPATEDERDEDTLYVDELSQDDKAFLFQWAVGGSSSLEKFREQSAQFVEAVLSGDDVASAPELPPPPSGPVQQLVPR
jgi:hypothetical protein